MFGLGIIQGYLVIANAVNAFEIVSYLRQQWRQFTFFLKWRMWTLLTSDWTWFVYLLQWQVKTGFSLISLSMYSWLHQHILHIWIENSKKWRYFVDLLRRLLTTFVQCNIFVSKCYAISPHFLCSSKNAKWIKWTIGAGKSVGFQSFNLQHPKSWRL